METGIETNFRSVIDEELVEVITSINIPIEDYEDEFVWGPNSCGNFTIKSTTLLQFTEPSHSRVELLQMIWKLNIPPKAKVFAWLLLRGRLKTRVFLAQFLHFYDKSCALCGAGDEDSTHLFTQCPIASTVWSLSNHIPNPTRFPSLDGWITAIFNSQNHKVIEDCVLLCWKILKARNDSVFRGATSTPMSIVSAAASTGVAFRSANPKTPHSSSSSRDIIKWLPPAPNWLKLNFDGVVSNLSAAVGFVIRNHFGKPVLAGALKLPPRTAIEAEASALLEGLKAASRLNCDYLNVEGDAAVIIQCAKNRCPHPWKIKSTLREILRIATSFKEITFSNVLREANFLVDSIASTGHGLDSLTLWWDDVPPSALHALALDSSGVGRLRGALL